MKCLFCGGEIVDTTALAFISTSESCIFSFYWCEILLCHYVCINRRIAIIDSTWRPIIKRRFLADGTFISYDTFNHKGLEFDYKVFLKGGFVF